MSTPPPPPELGEPTPNLAPTFSLLNRAFSGPQALEIFNSKISHKPLLLHPTSPRGLRCIARLQKPSANKPSRKPQPLSAKAKRVLGVHKVPRNITYESVAVLHNLWLGYAGELVTMGGGASVVAGRLASGDLHGTGIEVVRSRCTNRVGVKGIVVKDTRGAFEIIVKASGVKTVPKDHTVFRVEVPLAQKPEKYKEESGKEALYKEGRAEDRKMTFDIHGSQLMLRAADRANRKFKPKPILDL